MILTETVCATWSVLLIIKSVGVIPILYYQYNIHLWWAPKLGVASTKAARMRVMSQKIPDYPVFRDARISDNLLGIML